MGCTCTNAAEAATSEAPIGDSEVVLRQRVYAVLPWVRLSASLDGASSPGRGSPSMQACSGGVAGPGAWSDPLHPRGGAGRCGCSGGPGSGCTSGSSAPLPPDEPPWNRMPATLDFQGAPIGGTFLESQSGANPGKLDRAPRIPTHVFVADCTATDESCCGQAPLVTDAQLAEDGIRRVRIRVSEPELPVVTAGQRGLSLSELQIIESAFNSRSAP